MPQRNFPQRCRNQNAGLDGPMSRARLALRGRHRFLIGFSFFKHPKARLRKVASHGHFGFAMAAARFNPLVKSADMIVATALAIENRAVGSFHKGPLQIHIDISTNRSVVKFPPAGVLTRHQPAVASELLSTGETLHSPNLGPNHHCQDISHSRQTLKQVCFSAWSESLHHLRFDHFKILIDMIELPEHPSNCLFSIGRKLDQNSLHNRTSFFAKASLASSTTNPYFAKVACTRFLSCVLCRLNTMRVRGSSRASRTDKGGIQTVGNVPVLCSRFIPLASSLSLLFTLPIISFASRALTSCGFPPPSSISSTIQYQFPTVSTATGDCLSHRLIKFLMLP